MSEIQNKAVALVVQIEGDLVEQSPADRSTLFLKRALDLYFALGGEQSAAMILADAQALSPRLKVEAAVADVMIELAAASHLNDIDMVQATYNRLDAELITQRSEK